MAVQTEAQLSQLAKKQKLSELYNIAKAKLDSAVGKYSAGEMSLWTDLEFEANDYIDNATLGALLQAEADASGKSYTDHANSIIANATAFRSLRVAIVGNRTTHKDIIDAMPDTDHQAIILIDVTTGWPV